MHIPNRVRSSSHRPCYYCPRHGCEAGSYTKAQLNIENKDANFWGYCEDMFGTSSINGVSQIASTKQFRRIIWIAVFFGCLAGFLYQTISFLMNYYEYPSAVEVVVINEGALEFPSVTLCNTNRIRKSAYCKYLEDEHKEEDCPKNTTFFELSDEQINSIQVECLKAGKLKIRREMGHNKTSMFIQCSFNGDPKLTNGECIARFNQFYDPDFGNCYSFDSQTEDGGEILRATESDVWQDLSELILILNAEEKEYTESFRDPGFLITFHSARIYPDPFSDGFQVKPGFTYSFALQKFTNELLPLPYKTNCTDYTKLPWKRHSYDRKLSTRMCTAECSRNQQQKHCNSVTDDIRLFFDDASDDNDTREEMCAKYVSNATMDYCRSLCRVPCNQTTFKVTTDSSIWPRKDKGASLNDLGEWKTKPITEITKNIARVKVYFSTMEHTVYRNYPKYKPFELFSFLGGYVGIWLGISLVAVFEFLERLVLTLTFPLQKRRKKLKSSKIKHIMAFPNSGNH